MGFENSYEPKQEIIPKKSLGRGEVCSINEWLEYCQRQIDNGSGWAAVEEYDIKPMQAAAAAGYSFILRLPQENTRELSKKHPHWFAQKLYFSHLKALAKRHSIECVHAKDQYFAFQSRDDAKHLSELVAEAQQNGLVGFEQIEGEVIPEPKQLSDD